jgi:integrase
VTFSTRTEAQRFLSKTRTAIDDGTWKKIDLGNQSFAPFANRFLESHRGNIREVTAVKYETHLRVHVFPRFGERSLNSIKSIDVSEWVSDLADQGFRLGTIRGAHGIMRQVMTEAVRSGLIDANPCAHTRFPKMARYEPNIITPTEANLLIEEMPERYKAFVMVLAYCGLRFGEAAALRRESIDLNRRVLDVTESVTNAGGKTVWSLPKTYEKRSVSLPAFLVDALRSHMETFTDSEERSLVFTGDKGGWIQNNNFHNRVWNPIVRNLVNVGSIKIPVVPKDLRASCGSWVAAENGVLEAAKRLGHSSTATTTKHYARPLAGRDVVVAKNLDVMFQAALGEISVAS